jgi:hypothetical protein
MTSTLSRRSALAVVGTLSAAAVPIPAMAYEGKPSALIEDLMERRRAALAKQDAADKEWSLADKQYDQAEPTPPEASRPRSGDAELGISPPLGRLKSHYAAPCDMPDFDACTRNTCTKTETGNRTVFEVIHEDWPERRARVEEIRAAYSRWVSECEALPEFQRYMTVNKKWEECTDMVFAIEADIQAAPVTCWADVLAKLQVFKRTDDGTSGDDLAAQIARDIILLSGV